jgi:hypothetical protein
VAEVHRGNARDQSQSFRPRPHGGQWRLWIDPTGLHGDPFSRVVAGPWKSPARSQVLPVQARGANGYAKRLAQVAVERSDDHTLDATGARKVPKNERKP